jgi:ribosomal protein S18 acetylase RimI-like enzyme
MDSPGVQIGFAKPSEVAQLARIHATALPDDFLPALGRDFLESVYYPSALRSRYACTLVALVAGEVAGFATVAHEADRFLSGVIRENLVSVAYYVTRRILIRPRTLLEVLGLARATFTGTTDAVSGEIVFIAVDAAQRGNGLGKALVRAAVAYLSQQQVNRCRTKTLAANDGVIAMYRGLGWDVREQFRLVGRDYVTIVSPLAAPNHQKESEL